MRVLLPAIMVQQLPPGFSAEAIGLNDSVLVLLFDGEAPVQLRPRAAMSGRRTPNRIIMYDPSQACKRSCEILVTAAIREIFNGPLPYFGQSANLKVSLDFRVEDDRKDVDNLIKFFLDVMSKIVYSDDRYVRHLIATKVKINGTSNGNPGVSVTIERLDN